MNTTSRIITGTLAIVLGLILIMISFFNAYFLLLYGIPIFVIGIFILFNKKEDQIEKIKTKSKEGRK